MFERKLYNSIKPKDERKCIAPVLAAGLITGGASLGSAIIGGISANNSSKRALEAARETNEANLQIARETNQANKDLYQQSFQDSLYAWDLQNQYNSPSKEVERLRQAGLNPAMAFGDATNAGSVTVPTAAPAQGATMQMAPYEAYSDSFISGFLQSMPNFSESLLNLSKFNGQMIDNQTRDEYNKVGIAKIETEIDNLLQSSKLSKEQRSYYEAQKEFLQIQKNLFEDKYADSLDLSNLQVKFQELQNRVMSEQNARDAARLAIESLESQSRIFLNNSQAHSVKVMANLAINTDWRNEQQHVIDMNLKSLDEQLKRLGVSRQTQDNIFASFMQTSEMVHSDLKDASLVNKLAERAFGLGFRDIGMALRNLLGK